MRRFRALVLLGTLLALPVSILAGTVCSNSQCCCRGSGALCPMHRDQKSEQKKIPCRGTDQTPPSCFCAHDQQAPAAIPQFARKATVNVHRALFVPATTYELNLLDSGTAMTRFISPPEQPPR
jgi:hypothetical protein